MRVAWVGDSITVGSAPVARDRLRASGKLIELSTFARVGASLPEMAGHYIPDDVDLVILAGGTNDLAAVSADKAFERLMQTRAALSSRGKRVVVATIPPSAKKTAETEQFNARVRALPLDQFIDTGGKLGLSELSKDGVHPASYGRLGDLYAEAIASLESREKVDAWWPWVAGAVGVGILGALLAHRRSW